MSWLKQSDQKREFNLPLRYCSTLAFNRLGSAHPHWGGQSTLLSPPILRHTQK